MPCAVAAFACSCRFCLQLLLLAVACLLAYFLKHPLSSPPLLPLLGLLSLITPAPHSYLVSTAAGRCPLRRLKEFLGKRITPASA